MQDTVLITIDSLRADHVSHLGYDRETTPNIDYIAKNSTTFTNAFSHACSTRPSFPSILTSAYATMYGGYEQLSDDQTIISEVFDNAGYQTAGFHSNLYLGGDFGYNRGFDTFYDSKTDPSLTAQLRQMIKNQLDSDGFIYKSLARAFDVAERQAGANVGSAYVSAEEITNKAIEWIKDNDTENPGFIWIHYMDVHHPYVPPEKYQKEFRDKPVSERQAIKLRRKMIEDPDAISEDELSDIIDLYDAEIRYCDAEIGRLISTLQQRWSDPTVMITSDHGEAFGEHGKFSHHATFHDEVIHVPLIFDDGNHNGEYDDFVGLLDISPTLVDTAGLIVPDNFHGRSIQDLFAGNWNRDGIIGDWINTDTGERRIAYRDNHWKYIQIDDRKKLYNLRQDPEETNNVIDQHEDIVGQYEDLIRNHKKITSQTDTDIKKVEMDESVKQRLRKLGYKE